MAPPIIQVDYEQLQQVSRTFEVEAGHVKQILRRVQQQTEQLSRTGWVGSAASRVFYTEMDRDLLPGIARLASALDRASQTTIEIMRIFAAADDEAAGFFRGGYADSVSTIAPHAKNIKLADGELRRLEGSYGDGDIDVLFVNGIQNNPDGFANSMGHIQDYLSNKYGNGYGKNVDIAGIYNATDGKNTLPGWAGDIQQAFFDRQVAEGGAEYVLGKNRAVDALINAVENDFRNGNGQITLMAHSQGAAITAVALQELARRGEVDMSQITVKTFGGFGTDFPPGPQYHHYVHADDPIPIFARGVDAIDNRYEGGFAGSIAEKYNLNSNTVVYDDPNRILGASHDFQGYMENMHHFEQIESTPKPLSRYADDFIDATISSVTTFIF